MLIRRLGVCKAQVRGHLEMLWDAAHESGNPVFECSEAVEAVVDWPGEAGSFVTLASQQGSNFLDLREDGRYEIHDYWHHAPKYVASRHAAEAERRKQKSCDHCGGPYHSEKAFARFCSDSCRQSDYRKRNRDESVTEENDLTNNVTQHVTQRYATPAPAPAPAPAPNEERLEHPSTFVAGISPVESEQEQPKADPLDAYPKLAERWARLQSAIRIAHPKAKLPTPQSKQWWQERKALADLCRLDGFSEVDVLKVFAWVFKAETQNAQFWLANFRAIKPLRVVKSGASKFAKMHEAMERDNKPTNGNGNGNGKPQGDGGYAELQERIRQSKIREAQMVEEHRQEAIRLGIIDA
jgi:endogenous inhibitor of DNA gyrase (YacG/DUF329 family)